MNEKRRYGLNRKSFIFYLWLGLAYFMLWFLHSWATVPESFSAAFFNNLWRFIYVFFANILFLEFTLPFVLRKREYLVYNIIIGFFALWIHAMIWSFGLYTWRELGIALGIYNHPAVFLTTSLALESQMAYSMGSLFFMGVGRHIYNYIKLNRATQLLRIEKQEAELNYLKSQTNPHFLFNTLNNIYSLARDKSDLAPESILKLSKILRYMLYEIVGDNIAIEQEIKIIEDYIALEKLRYDESLQVRFSHDIEDMKQALPPLLMMPLIENAFKHGASETRDQPFVEIHVSLNKRVLNVSVKNSTDKVQDMKKVRENIGLSNLRRQLELLYKEYDLNVEQKGDVFIAQLKINLASHV